MKIEISKKGGMQFSIAFPTALLCNRFSAFLVRRSLKKEGITLTKNQTAGFLKALKQYRKTHPDWTLVEVTHADGRQVLIRP